MKNINKNSELIEKMLSKGTVSADLKDFNLSNDPYFIKKAEEAKKFVDKVGFPKEFMETK